MRSKNNMLVLVGIAVILIVLLVVVGSLLIRTSDPQNSLPEGMIFPTPTPIPTAAVQTTAEPFATYYVAPVLTATPGSGVGIGGGVGTGGVGVTNTYVAPTPAPTATRNPNVLRNGDENEKVRTMQQRLIELGYLGGKADGIFGDGTEAALKAFQKAHGLDADGVFGAGTSKKLYSSSAKPKATAKPSATKNTAKATSRPAPNTYVASTPKPGGYGYLEPGNSGSSVRKLQNRLIELGYLSGSASGTYDSDTEAAVYAFQVRNGQWADGLAGPDTQSALFSSKALAAENSSVD